MSLTDQLPALQIVIPLIGAPVCVLLRHARAAWVVTLLCSIACTLVACALVSITQDGTVIRYELGGWSAPSGIEYYVDIVNASVLLIVSFISTIVCLYAWRGAEKEVQQDKHYLFYTGWLLCITGLLGIAITGDAFNAFVFLEISSLATYLLISLGPDRNSLTAAFRYLIMGSIGASFILIGVGFLYAATGTLNMADLSARIPVAESSRTVLIAFSFLTVGLMIKAAIFPLHAWLANAYHYAPVTVTALLSGTATKVSLYLLLRFFFNVFGIQFSFGQMLLSYILLPAAIVGFLLMSIVAVYQTDIRRMLAYSSVAQIGYIVAAISLVTPLGISAGIVHIINHALIKASLFMVTGCLVYRLGHAHIASLGGVAKSMPVTFAAFVVSGLSLIGVPLTAGFISKFNMIAAMLERGWWIGAALILVSSLMATLYIGRIVEVMLFRKPRTSGQATSVATEAPWEMLVPVWILIAISIFFGLFGSETLSIASAGAERLLQGSLAPPLLDVPASSSSGLSNESSGFGFMDGLNESGVAQ